MTDRGSVGARTHLGIDRDLCGEAVAVEPGKAVVALRASAQMTADEHGLVHGGFVFGLADYAAMLAVNEPNVVLVSADCRFRRPVRVGDDLRAEATVLSEQGHRCEVEVTVRRGDEIVLDGLFQCAVTRRHVLEATS